ncbi:MAG: hypothetical protein QHH24_03400 [Candidatus Bathyarchaeota archaeon]|nr:hypothetical protein [Candidatus Bathyarchaeota archaeon]
MKTKLLATAIVTMLVLGAFAVLPPAFAARRIYLVPSTISYTTSTMPGSGLFTVSVWVETDTDLGGVQVYMEFDDSIINATRFISESGNPSFFMPQPPPASELPAPPDPGYQHLGPNKGRVQVAVSKGGLPPNAPWGHSGIFGTFEFEITALPQKSETLTCALHLNTSSTYFLDPTSGEVPGVSKEDGSYTLIWAPPTTNPYFAVDPASKVFGPDPPSAIGQAFDETIMLKNLDAAWGITAASCRLTYNSTVIDVMGGLANITVNTADWDGATSVTYVAGQIDISVATSKTLGGNVLIATITFTVLIQKNAPPAPLTDKDESPLTLSNEACQDHVGPIPTSASVNGLVTVWPLRQLDLPWLEVVPTHSIMGPDPDIGETFTVGIKLTSKPPIYLDPAWKLIGVQFRLFYDPTLIGVVGVTEGPFLQGFAPYGTLFISSVESNGLGPHVLVGEMILPNGTGYWNPPWPKGQGIVANIEFEVLKQECPLNFTCDLELTGVFGEWAIDAEGNYIPFDAPVNGDYTILPFDQPGRVIDIYGGANNNGYWTGYPGPFPAPYGGQGIDHWMDIVFPQSEITIYAYVTYNYWPVQSKQVGFEIEGPYEKLPNGTLVPKQRYQIWAKLTATTNASGIAVITYRMPWPCEDPDGITGIWKITGTVVIADVVVTDTIIYYYERLVYITNVTTDSFYYTHDDCITVTVDYQTHAVQMYPALFAVTLTDDLGVPFGMKLHATNVGGATFCTWKRDKFSVTICIPKWAYAGYGLVHVTCYDKDPTDGGYAITPEYAPAPEFQIGPY